VRHVGVVAYLIMAVAFIAAFFNRRNSHPPVAKTYGLLSDRLDLVALVLTMLFPIAVLTIDIAKSPVVGGIIIGPIVLFAALVIATVWPIASSHSPKERATGGNSTKFALRFALRESVVTIFALVVAISTFVAMSTKPPRAMSKTDLDFATRINFEVNEYVTKSAPKIPAVSFDRIMEYLNWGTLRLFAYEQQHRLVDFQPLFGHSTYGIFATPRDIAFQLFMRSDVIVLTERAKGRDAPYPMNTKIQEYWDDIHDWVSRNRIELLSGTIAGIRHAVFVVPPIALAPRGTTLADGVSISVDQRYLDEMPFILLEGARGDSTSAAQQQLRIVPVGATDSVPQELPGRLITTGQIYKVVIDARRLAASGTGVVRIDLTAFQQGLAAPLRLPERWELRQLEPQDR
jgi:hypothetical protein